MTQLPEPFRRKIDADAALAAHVIHINEAPKLLRAVRAARSECRAALGKKR